MNCVPRVSTIRCRNCIRFFGAILTIIIFGDYRTHARDLTDALAASGWDTQIKIEIAVWLLLGSIVAIALIRHRLSLKISTHNPLVWYLVFVCFALFSVAYTPLPALALFRATQILLAIFIIVWLKPTIDDINLLLRLFLVVNIGSYFFLPHPVIRYQPTVFRFCTMVCPQANACGMLLATGAILSLVFFSKTAKSAHLAWLLSFFIFTLLTGSRTAIIALIGGILLVAPLSFRTQVLVFIAVIAATCTFLISSSLVSTAWEHFVRTNVSDIYTLTGRIYLWKDALAQWWESPLWGGGFLCTRLRGYGVFAQYDSMFLDALVQMGVIGFFLLLGFWVAFLRLFFRRKSTVPLVGILSPLFLYSITGTTFSGALSLPTVLGMSMAEWATNISMHYKSNRTAKANIDTVATRLPSQHSLCSVRLPVRFHR